ncbi:MAG: flavohemoglobin expression-modulating QEGLA motif protein [Woeseiaceae bacterium]
MKHVPASVSNSLPPLTRYVDERMGQICHAFDWLKAVSPCRTQALWENFKAGGFRVRPRFRYRDPGIDIDATRKALLDLPISKVEEPVFKALLAEKQRELDRQLELMELRGTRGFMQVSIDLFGVAAADLYAAALHILHTVDAGTCVDRNCVGAAHLIQAAKAQFTHYRRQRADFSADVRPCRDITAGLMVSKGCLIVSDRAHFPRDRVDALLHHEIGTHILTWYNGGQQPLRQLQFGLAHYDELQEGLGVLSEYLSGNLSPLRLRTLAARVVAVRQMTDGADFRDVFEALRSEYAFRDRAAFIIATRVFRGGGLTKDVVYLRGLRDLLEYLREGHPFERLFAGKFSLSQLPAIKTLCKNGQLNPPALVPSYMHNARAQERLADCGMHTLDNLYQRLVA